MQTNTNASNLVEFVSNLRRLVGNTSSLMDQTMMNFDVIVGLVNISREIINDSNIESGRVMEVSL